MKIYEVIEKMKRFCKGYGEIDEKTTRDQVLYGNVDQECKGVITTCWASIDVINEALNRNVNLIICHEALFWNHGDHTDWLDESKNLTYFKKKELLEQGGIVVWRFHDYIHSGIKLNEGKFVDGIFYGLACELGWKKYAVDSLNPLYFLIEPITVKELAKDLITKLHLNGVKILGNPDSYVEKVCIPFHILGDAKNEIMEANLNNVDCFLTMELVDYTLSEYIRDASMLNYNKSIICMGHFNLEEPGMKYITTYFKEAVGDNINCYFVQSGDMYNYLTNINNALKKTN